jgi:hypothetical protein
MRLPQVSAIIPVGTSKITCPSVKKALARNAWKLDSPAFKRKIVFIPQIKEAARVFPKTRYR